MERYQYILLDWDGNLAKSLDLWLSALKVPLEARGYYWSDQEVGASFNAFRERLEARGFKNKEIDAIIVEADAISIEQMPSVELYPDTLEVLEGLRKLGKHTALVTTSEHAFIDSLLDKYHMNELFDAIVCGDDVVRHKPHPEPLLKAMSYLKADPARTVMIGDSDKDIDGAKNAGVDSILFYPPSHQRFFDIEPLRSLQPTYIVSDFREVLKIVSQSV